MAAAKASDRGRAVWRMRLTSAFRTALACSIVGCTTLYGPASIRILFQFRAFAYVTTILIVADATLGEVLRGCWHALQSTVLVVPPSILCLWIIGPTRFSEGVAAMAVAVGAFLVALPKSTSLLTKRIAFGQLVIVYVGVIVQGEHARPVMHPVHVAASTALGASASIVAMLLPYPWLAFREVRKLFNLYTDNASERTSLFMKAFFSQDKTAADDLINQAQPFAETGVKLLQHIKLIQEGVQWERPRIRDFKPNLVYPADRLQDVETILRGMETAIASISSFPVSMIDQELSSVLLGAEVQQGLKLEQAKCFLPLDAMTVPETKGKLLDKAFQSLPTASLIQKDLPAFFFLSCIEQILTDPTVTLKPQTVQGDGQKNNPEESTDSGTQTRFSFNRIFGSSNMRWSNERLVFALKCSLALGLAVFLGLSFDKANGYWSGLTIAISFVTGRQPTFTVANARVQGTAIGSVYGVLGCFIFHRFTDIRFIILLPWIIFTSLLRHSQMYGQAGGISAVIGALLILGRKNYGPPDEFAIARLTEASIGLLCLIIVELLLQPARAATLAKNQLSQCLGTLRQCIQQTVLSSIQKEKGALIFQQLKENQRKLNSHVNELKKFTEEAESEPDFWFLPFRGSCYHKLHGSLSKMVDLMHFMVYNMEFLLQVSQRSGVAWKELQEHMDSDLENFAETVNPCLKRLEKINLIKSIDAFDQQVKGEKRLHDLESGKPQTSNVFHVLTTCNDTAEKILNSFIQHSKEVTGKIQTTEDDEELKGKTILCLNSLGFCISGLMRETTEIENAIKDLVRRENPSRHVDFNEICCKIDTVYP